MSKKLESVAIFHYGGNYIRGSETCLLHTIDALEEIGVDILLVSNNPTLAQNCVSDSITHITNHDYAETMIDGSDFRLPLARYARALKQTRSLLKKQKTQLILCSGGLPNQLLVPLGKLLKIPVVCHLHHPAPRSYYFFWLIKYTTALFYPSRFTQLDVKKKCGRLGAVIYNAVDLKRRYRPASSPNASWRKQYGIAADSIVIGQVAALTAHKRPDLLIKSFAEALKTAPNMHLVLIGQGPLEQQLQRQANELGASDKVTLTGYVEDVLPFLQHVININVLASIEEGLGVSVIEASGCALPSIVSDCTGLKEVVKDGITGVKYPPDDYQALTIAITKLAQNPELSRELGQKARAFALEKFSLIEYKQSIQALFQKQLQSQQK